MSRFYLFVLLAIILFVKPTFAYYSEYNEVDEQRESKILYHSVTDSVTPSLNYYANLFVFSNVLSMPIGLAILDFDIEKENRYRGSLMFNFSSIFRFYDFRKDWEGFKSIWSVGIGYRQYLGTIFFENVDSTNAPVKYRNIPYNSLSVFFIQVMVSPSLLFDNYKIEVNLEKHSSFGLGGFVMGKVGVVWNLRNFLLEMGFFCGYQYWNGVKSSVYNNNKGFAFVNVCPSKGHCFGAEIKFGL